MWSKIFNEASEMKRRILIQLTWRSLDRNFEVSNPNAVDLVGLLVYMDTLLDSLLIY